MLQEINRHIALIDDAVAWAEQYHRDAFPYDVFKDYRRRLRRISAALKDNCSVAAYGESQVGKSYLMSGLLSSPSRPFVITNADRPYSFIDEINPSGGKNAQIESTGVITRFTLRRGPEALRGFVKGRNLSVVDIILLLVDSYYNDIKINPDSVLSHIDVNNALDGMSHLWEASAAVQNEIAEDDVKDISDYLHDVVGSAAAGISQSNFCKVVAPVIQYVPYDRWVDIFGLLWNRNDEMSRLFDLLVREYRKLGFATDVYIPFDAVLEKQGTLLKIDWLDTVCGIQKEPGRDVLYTDVYDAEGHLLAHDFHKGHLSALLAELTFELPESVAEDRQFLHKMDLLDFPGARSREKYKEQEIHAVMPKILRRGKVAYLFNKYSRSLQIGSVLFCHHNNQKAEATIGETINDWIENNIGATPDERAKMLAETNGIAPLFLIATKFNIDLERIKTDSPANVDKLDAHWNRFNIIFPEIIKPNKWLDDWVTPGGMFPSRAFQNIYPLRDFYWSGKNGVFDGYSDGAVKSAETGVHRHADYPDYFENLKASFLRNDFVRRHFADPERTWNDVATVNNDGSKAIIRSLDAIAGVLDGARRKRYLSQLEDVRDAMYNTLSAYYEPEDVEARNQKVKQIASDIRLSLNFSVGERPEIFGRIIDNLMVPVGDLRDIAYDIIVCHADSPKDFTRINFVRRMAGISPDDSREEKVAKLCRYLCCDADGLEERLKSYGVSLSEVVSDESEALTTVADVVTKHIVDYWNAYINNKVKVLEPMLPHAEAVLFMLQSLLKKLNIEKVLSERIRRYGDIFSVGEQPNAIADYAALTLNNFVSSAGRSYIRDEEVESIRAKAGSCQIDVDFSPVAWNAVRKAQPLLEALESLDAASDIGRVDRDALMRLPLWGNFQRWMNLVTIGLLYASDISQVDPAANARVKELIDGCGSLYKQ